MAGELLFETERLAARRLNASDASAMVAIFGDEETMRYVGDTKTLTEADCLYWIEDVTAKNYERRGYGLHGLFDKSDGTLVACSGIFHPGQQEEPEVMYWLRRDRWGKGYATEIVRGIVDHAQTQLQIHRIIATIHPENLPSQRVAAKAGFHRAEDRVHEDGSIIQVWEWNS